ncbi:MAG: putative glycoside hydrolase, partial [Patescibacteria group bacterium]
MRDARGKNSVSRGAIWSAAGVLAAGAVVAFLTTGFAGKAFASLVSAIGAMTPSSVSYTRGEPDPEGEVPQPAKQEVAHIPTPESVKAVYMSQCAAGTPSFREALTKLIDTTELNAIVIDIRDYTGKIAFPTDNPILKDMVSDECGARDMKKFLEDLHVKNIYVIGRITVFQNPHYTKVHPEQAVQHKNGGIWKDRKGLAFVDVGATAYWDTVVELSKESYDIGFDELNFDYIRYPSDGDMAAAVYIKRDGKTKQEMLEDFFKYLHEKVAPMGVKMSADLFGMTATNVDDLNIGQVLERTLPYFDFIDPMVYPSHYPSGFHGYKDVNANAYNIVHFSMAEAVR